MCGIAAIINPTPKGKSEMEFMLRRIEHRGDTTAVQVEMRNSILGSTRLKIVDRQNGSQPFFNESQTIGVVFNGEIYNYKKLKSELESKGHRFISDCDTEVLIHLYEEYGINFLHQLEGMFAFLLYDLVQDKFFGVRDFFGVKPLFYCRSNKSIYFSSEMKSFTELEVEIFEELKPGHYITNDGIVKYYKLPTTTWNPESVSTITNRVRELVELAVKKRVETDLPIATYLSGGLDSSIVHLLCCKYHNDVTAIIIGEDSSDDVTFATRLCNDLNLKFHHIRVDKESLIESIPEVIYSIETFEPNPIRGSVLSMKLSEAAQNLGFKVVLCGEGSDEIFAGYGDFLFINNENEFQAKILSLLSDLYRTQLLRIDRTSMKYAVEVREPFLDRSLVEYVLNVLPSQKVGNNFNGKKTTKVILREAFKDLLPDYVYSREKMTLMEGAGTGSVEKGNGLLFEFAINNLSDKDFQYILNKYTQFSLADKEEAFCFKIFNQFYSKATFTNSRVINSQKEINQH